MSLYDEIWQILNEYRECTRRECPEWCSEFTDEEVKELARKYEK